MEKAWQWVKANKSLVIKVAAILIIAANQILAAVGAVHTGASDDQIYMIVSSVITIATVGAAAWKNFNFTNAAVVAQKVLDAIKDGKITADEIESVLESVEAAVEPEKDGVE